MGSACFVIIFVGTCLFLFVRRGTAAKVAAHNNDRQTSQAFPIPSQTQSAKPARNSRINTSPHHQTIAWPAGLLKDMDELRCASANDGVNSDISRSSSSNSRVSQHHFVNIGNRANSCPPRRIGAAVHASSDT